MKHDVPKRCTLCLSFSGNRPHNDCVVCRDQHMAETFLCDIVRKNTKPGSSFACQTFRPRLTLVGQKKSHLDDEIPVCQDKNTYFAEVVRSIASSGCGSGGCGACQSSGKTGVSSRKFHIVWSVYQRRAVFADPGPYVSFLHDIFMSCGRLMAGKALLVWLANDHLHLYLEIGTKEKMEHVVEDLQGLVQDALFQKFEQVAKEFDQTKMWESDYFFEEIV
ncbi:MAG: transposase [Desulfobulbaceae bacterium]|nr:transposase [Desulfobulbaceae bacterium]